MKKISLYLNLLVIPCFFLTGFTDLKIKPAANSTIILTNHSKNGVIAQAETYLLFLPLVQKQEVKAYYVSPQGNDS